MAFEKVKAFATEKWNAVTDWYYENEDEILDAVGTYVGIFIGGYIGGKISYASGYVVGHSKGYDAGQKNAINVIADFNKKA